MKSATKKTKQRSSTLGRRATWLSIVVINLLLAMAWWLLYQRTVLSFQAAPTVIGITDYRAEPPVRVKLGQLKIDLPLESSHIVNGIWETSNTQVSYLADSARPGEGGNIVMYAHNRPQLFGKLGKLQPGDTVQVEVADGTTYEYRVDSLTVVKPENVSAVLPTKKEVLTLYTCTGWLDSERLVVQATPTQVISAN